MDWWIREYMQKPVKGELFSLCLSPSSSSHLPDYNLHNQACVILPAFLVAPSRICLSCYDYNHVCAASINLKFHLNFSTCYDFPFFSYITHTFMYLDRKLSTYASVCYVIEFKCMLKFSIVVFSYVESIVYVKKNTSHRQFSLTIPIFSTVFYLVLALAGGY